MLVGQGVRGFCGGMDTWTTTATRSARPATVEFSSRRAMASAGAPSAQTTAPQEGMRRSQVLDM